jgi:beta-1,2-mannobiose phosphorylase / 1,2-beta-oligomannan phosphorylase
MNRSTHWSWDGRRARWAAARRAAVVVAVLVVAQVSRPATAAEFPPELIDFGPASADPLFAGGGADAWDRDLRERGWIMRDGGRWHLWYTGSNRDRDPVRRLGYATGTDGLNWTRAAGPLVADAWVEDVCIVKQGGCYRMFAEGEEDIAHLLTSTDRLRWRRHGPLDIRTVDGRPIPAGPRGTPAVWFERGTWHLYYERRDKGVWLATSRDLCTFTNVSDEPVLACGPDDYDCDMIAVDQIVRCGGRFYAYYHACSQAGSGRWSTCLAASDDLVHWRKYPGNPVLPVDPDHPGRSSATLVHDGTRLRLYTTHPDVRVRFSTMPVPARALDR